MSYRYRPAPRWLAFDGTKFVDLSRRVNGWDFSHGTDLHFSEAAFGIRPAQGFLRLDNGGGAFAPGNWQGPVPVVYGVGGLTIWTGFAQAVGALPTGARDEIAWPLNSGLWRKYRKPARFTQRDQTTANSTPNGVLLQILTSLADDDNGVLRLSGRTPAGWLSDARQDPADWFLRYVRSTGTLARLINDLAAASMCIPFEDRFGRIGLTSLVDQNKTVAPNTGDTQHVQAVGSFLGETASLDLWGVQVAGLTGLASSAFTLSQQFQIPAGVSGPFLATFEYRYPDGTVHVDWAKGATPANVNYEIVSVEALPYTLGDAITVAFGGTSTQPFALEVVGTPVIDAADFTVSRRVHTQGATFSAATEFYEIEPWVNLEDSDSALAPAGGVAQFFSAQRVNPTLRYAMWGDTANSVPQFNDLGSSLGTQLVPARVKGFRTGLGVNPPLIPLQFRHFNRDTVPMVDIECTGWVQEFTSNPRTIPPTVPGVPTVIPPSPEQLNPVVNVAAQTSSVVEGSPAVFTVTANPAPASPLVVTVQVSQTGAHVDDDEIGVRTVTVPISGAVNVSIPTLGDTADEPDGTVSLRVLANADLYRLASLVTAATIMISDDDVPLPVISIAGKAASVVEGNPAVFTITANPAPTAPLVVNVTVSQTGDYVEAANIGAKSVAMPISGSVEYSVPTVDDVTDEADGSVSVQVTANAALYALASLVTAATVIVTDDDVPRPGPSEPMIVATLTNVEGVGIDFTSTGFAVLDTGYFRQTGERKAFSTLIRMLRSNGTFDADNTVRIADTNAIVGRPPNTARGFNSLLWDSARQRYWVLWINRSGEGVTSDRLRAFLTNGTEVDAAVVYRTLNVFPVGMGTIGGGNIGTISRNSGGLMQRFFIRPFDPDRVDTDTLRISGLTDIGNGAGLGVYQRDVAGTITDFLACMNDEGVLYTLTVTTTVQATRTGATFSMPQSSLFAGFAIATTTRDPNNNDRQLAVARIRLANGQHRIETFWFTPPSTPQAGDAVIEQSTVPGSLWHMAQQEAQ